MNQITYENKVLGFEKDISTSEKTIQDLEKKLADYQADLADLIGTTSTTPGSTNEKEFVIQVNDAYQTIKLNLITIDEFLGMSAARKYENDNYEYLISARDTSYKAQAEQLWTELSKVTAPTNITLTQ
jgi:hypothetical protein